ncbi:FG-GAP repeat domain-containing protein [Streptomyces sp. NPDC020681]|uniref:FG-GAP repeat domain-containing protein n=1 Tax=Streptomyces sp. NPDC020681 TaxID=3365083 RepID=UPI0037AA9FBD
MEPGRFSAPFRRARRIAACTALAVSAGMLLAVPAAADDTPPAPVEQTKPVFQHPTLTLPKSAPKATGTGDSRVTVEAQDDVPVAKPRADIDGDGYSELIYRGIDNQIWVTPSNGDPDYVYNFASSEAENERYKDVFTVAGLEATGPVHFTLLSSGRLAAHRNGSGGLNIWFGTGWQIYNKVFSPGDLTGDGSGDILARTPTGDLYLYPTTPGAAAPMGPRIKIGSGWQGYDQLIGVNDVNGDAIADLFARNPAGELYFYSGNPDVSSPFKGRVKVGNGWNGYNQIFGIDDLNGDGYAEVLARTPAGVLYSYISTGTGAFEARQQGGSGWNAASQFVGAGNNPHFGKNELVGIDTKGTLWAYYAMNNGLLSARNQASDIGGFQGAKITFSSALDADGFGELLELYNGSLYNLSHYTQSAWHIGSGWGIYTHLVGVGDLSGDGKGDLLARDSSGVLWLYRGDGSGTTFSPRIRLGSGWNAFNKLLGAGDVNGDGRADLIARGTDGKLYLYAGTGSATAPFKARTLIGSGWNTYNKLAAPGDLTGDGLADIVGVNAAGELYRYDANGFGAFKAKAKVGNGWNTYATLH